MKSFLKYFCWGLIILAIVVAVLVAIDVILPAGWTLSPEVLLLLASAVLSLSFTYMPGWRAEFAALSSQTKVYINLGLVTLLVIVIFLGTCTAWLPITGVTCSQAGLKTLFLYLFMAVGGNQFTYVLSAQPADVIEAKKSRAG